MTYSAGMYVYHFVLVQSDTHSDVALVMRGNQTITCFGVA